MASNIKGIVIEIEGKTSGLVQSLKEVDGSIKDTQAALKKVNEALKLDPKNVQLVAEKQKLLADQIQNTEQKLKLLEQAAEDAAQALANGDISEAEYAQLAAEIELTKQKLTELNNEAKSNNGLSEAFVDAGKKLEEIGKKVEDVGGKMKEFGDGMTKYVTAPIVAGGALAVSSFNEVDASLDNIVKKTGVTGGELGQFKDIMNNIAKDIPADFGVISNAIGQVNTRFKLTGDDLEDLSKRFVEFADINDVDVVQSVNDVQSAMAAWGIDASQAGLVLDYMSAVAQDSGISIGNLTSLLTANAETFKMMGFSASDAMTFLGELELSGADASAVLGGLRRALNEAAAEGVPFDEALAQIQKDLENASTSQEAYNKAVDYFGGKSAGQMINALNEGTLSFDSFSTTLSDNAGTVTKTYDQIKGSNDSVKTSMNQLKITFGDIGESISSLLAPAIESLSEGLADLNEWWNSLSDGTQDFIIIALTVIAAIGPIIATIGTLIASIGGAIAAFGVITEAVGAAGFAGTLVALAPIIGTIIAVIASVIAIGWGLYEIVQGLINIFQNWDLFVATVSEDLGAAFSSIGEWFDGLAENINSKIESIKGWFSGMKDKLGEVMDGIKSNASESWDNILTTITTAVDNIKEAASERISAIGGFFSDLVSSAFTWGKDLLQNFIDGIKSLWGSFTGAINDLTGYIASNLGFSEPDEGPLSNFHTFAPDMIDLWNEGVYDNLSKVQDSTNAMTSTIAGGITGTDYSGALDGITGQLSAIAGNGQAINVYIGSERLGTAIARSNARTAYIAGGH